MPALHCRYATPTKRAESEERAETRPAGKRTRSKKSLARRVALCFERCAFLRSAHESVIRLLNFSIRGRWRHTNMYAHVRNAHVSVVAATTTGQQPTSGVIRKTRPRPARKSHDMRDMRPTASPATSIKTAAVVVVAASSTNSRIPQSYRHVLSSFFTGVRLRARTASLINASGVIASV